MTPQAQILVGAWEKRPWFFSSLIAIPTPADNDLAEASIIIEKKSAVNFFSFSLAIEKIPISKWWRKIEKEQANVEEIPNKIGRKVESRKRETRI